MVRRRREEKTTWTRDATAFDDFHDWVLSLPWVVERPFSLDTPGVRSFGVECEPLGRRRLWLLTGLQRELGINAMGLAVVVPWNAANDIECSGWGRSVAPMPGEHALVIVYSELLGRRHDIEALVLAAHGYAMS
jgi:hypothetical protein